MHRLRFFWCANPKGVSSRLQSRLTRVRRNPLGLQALGGFAVLLLIQN